MMFFGPGLARALHHPVLANVLAWLLIAVGVIGLVTDDMEDGWAILLLVVGAINVLRALVHVDGPVSG